MSGKKFGLAVPALMAAAFLAQAGTLSAGVVTYFDLKSYGTVAAGTTITDALGNTTAKLASDSITTLTSAGLTSIGGGNNGTGSNGLVFAAGSLAGFTGSFTIQDWVTTTGNGGPVLFGGNTKNGGNGWCGDGFTGVSTLIGFTWGGLASGGGAGNHTGTAYSQWGQHVKDYTLTSNSLSDIVLSYDASTYTFSQYVNGVLTGTKVNDFSSTSLAGVANFAIAGAPNAPWPDGSAAATTSAFLMYNQTLTSDQVAALHTAGAGASIATINTIVPEPASLGLIGMGGLALLARRRKMA